MQRFTSQDLQRNVGRPDKLVIAIEEMPEEFVAALKEPFEDLELAALDHLLDD